MRFVNTNNEVCSLEFLILSRLPHRAPLKKAKIIEADPGDEVEIEIGDQTSQYSGSDS